MAGLGGPINQETKQPCLCGCGTRYEAINTHLERVFKCQFQARLWARGGADNGEKILFLHSRSRQRRGGPREWHGKACTALQSDVQC